MLHKLGAKLGQLLPLIYSFFPLRMHFGDGNGDFFQYVHITTCFSCEAFIIHSLFLHSDAKLIKFKTRATGCLFSVGLQAGIARTDQFS